MNAKCTLKNIFQRNILGNVGHTVAKYVRARLDGFEHKLGVWTSLGR